MTIRLVNGTNELKQIKDLQMLNLRKNISNEEAAAQGFLSAEYTDGFLQTMHEARPSIIAKDGEVVAGYALVTVRSCAHLHPLLDDLFSTIDRTYYKNQLLVESNYVVVGQLCVAKEYRGSGLVQRIYNAFRDNYKNDFQYCITDVAEANARSLNAHLKSGFQVIDKLSYGGISWNIVLWDWLHN